MTLVKLQIHSKFPSPYIQSPVPVSPIFSNNSSLHSARSWSRRQQIPCWPTCPLPHSTPDGPNFALAYDDTNSKHPPSMVVDWRCRMMSWWNSECAPHSVWATAPPPNSANPPNSLIGTWNLLEVWGRKARGNGETLEQLRAGQHKKLVSRFQCTQWKKERKNEWTRINERDCALESNFYSWTRFWDYDLPFGLLEKYGSLAKTTKKNYTICMSNLF